MVTIRSIILILLFNTVTVGQSPDVNVSNPGDIWNIQFSGNSYYNADSLRTGLTLDLAVQLARADQIWSDQFADLIRRRVLRGYLNSGFRDVQVSTVTDVIAHTMTATITEGYMWHQRDVIVTGLSTRECEFVAALLRQGSSNALQKAQPGLRYWKKDSAMSFVESPETSYTKTVTAALTEIGFPQAEFTLAFPESSEDDKHTIDLQVTVTATGPSLHVGEITFTGLEKHSPEQMLAFLELKSGMPLTLMLREEIVSKLLKSGRFLMAEVTNDPFLFDPAELLNLEIRVREYDLVVPLGEEMTDVQKMLMKTSDWLSKWGIEGKDLHLKFSGPNGLAKDVVKSIVPEEYHSFCDPALGTGVPGTLCVDLLTSPKAGSVLTLQVIDPQGTVSMRRTLLLTSSTQGLLAWQNKKKWLRANEVSVVCTQRVEGLWGLKDDRRAVFQFGYGINSNPAKGLKSDFKTTAAAVIHLVHYGTPEVLLEGDLCRLTWETAKCEFDRSNGAIRNVIVSSDDAKMEITTGVSLVETELSRLTEETKNWTNQCQPGREWPALAAMILEDVRTADLENSDAILLTLDLLSDEAVVKHLAQAFAAYEERRRFYIPQENTTIQRTVAGLFSWLPFVSECIPDGSFPHLLGLTLYEVKLTGNVGLFQSVVGEFLKKNEVGAIYFDLLTRLNPQSQLGGAFARVGLERLSPEEFQRDVAPFINQPGAVHEIICGLLVWLQHTNDEEAEKLAALVARNVKDQDDQPINIRPLLVLIRSQREKPAEDLLPSLVPVLWEGGLREWVASDLKRYAASVPEDSKTYFNTKPDSVFKNTSSSSDSNDKCTDKKTKEVSRSDLFKTINLDEEWDLDK